MKTFGDAGKRHIFVALVTACILILWLTSFVSFPISPLAMFLLAAVAKWNAVDNGAYPS